VRTFLLLIAGGLLAASCGGSDPGRATPGASDEPPASSTTNPSTEASSSPSEPLPPPPSGTGQQPGANVPADLLNKVLIDAANRAGVTVDQVRVASATVQTWSDGSLGCPKPGEMYIQVLVDGYQIMVEAGGQTYDYRTSDRGSFKLCEQ
jgi:hypothetical protein